MTKQQISPILKIKNWLSLEDAARYLSGLLDEEMDASDILQLGIQGLLPISVYLTDNLSSLFIREETFYKFSELEKTFDVAEFKAEQRNELFAELSFLTFAENIPAGSILEIQDNNAKVLALNAQYREMRKEAPATKSKPPSPFDFLRFDALIFSSERHGLFFPATWGTITYTSFGKDGIEKEDDHWTSLPMLKLPENSKLVIRTQAFLDFAQSCANTDKVETNNNRSEKLQYLIQASNLFWKNASMAEKGTYPKTKEIQAWLQNKGYSEALSKSAATIIRPEWAETGRLPED